MADAVQGVVGPSMIRPGILNQLARVLAQFLVYLWKGAIRVIEWLLMKGLTFRLKLKPEEEGGGRHMWTNVVLDGIEDQPAPLGGGSGYNSLGGL